ncbi:MAG: GTP 3',8-cyclase MoaA, partial [Candidatus Nezhaarchaeota archaeon]|nr:GTP 3',8-cyclase MoaA [Candidatus Nezhaarchaeota archaeon]
GIDRVKLTGGEPLIRRDVVDFVRTAASTSGIAEVSMTTNGTLLAKLASSLANAGLRRVNVNVPSLRPERYRFITGCDLLDEVKDGVKKAADAGLNPVKLNVVVLRGINEDELQDFIDFASRVQAIVQLIELERLGRASSRVYDELHTDLSGVDKWLEEQASKIVFRGLHNRRRYVLPNGQEVEVVRPFHGKFCMGCTRLRLTADGRVRPCLMRRDNEVPVLDELNAGRVDRVVEKLREALELREPYFTQ